MGAGGRSQQLEGHLMWEGAGCGRKGEVYRSGLGMDMKLRCDS